MLGCALATGFAQLPRQNPISNGMSRQKWCGHAPISCVVRLQNLANHSGSEENVVTSAGLGSASKHSMSLTSICRFVARLLWRFRGHNMEVLDTPGPVLLVPNHVSWLDWFFLLACLDKD